MLNILDIFFTVFHSCVIVFNSFGWILKKTRLVNLITLSLTAASWFILGIFYGWGYCPLTDWHFQILHKLENTNLPNSYIKYLFDRILSTNLNANLVDNVTLIVFFVSIVVSLFLNIRDNVMKKRGKS